MDRAGGGRAGDRRGRSCAKNSWQSCCLCLFLKNSGRSSRTGAQDSGSRFLPGSQRLRASRVLERGWEGRRRAGSGREERAWRRELRKHRVFVEFNRPGGGRREEADGATVVTRAAAVAAVASSVEEEAPSVSSSTVRVFSNEGGGKQEEERVEWTRSAVMEGLGDLGDMLLLLQRRRGLIVLFHQK